MKENPTCPVSAQRAKSWLGSQPPRPWGFPVQEGWLSTGHDREGTAGLWVHNSAHGGILAVNLGV